MLAELEGRQFELEESGHAPSDKGAAELQKELDSSQMNWNATRLDLEAQITDLNRDLAQAKVSSNISEDHKQKFKALTEQLQQSLETTAEKDFILEQRTKEIEKLKEQLEIGQVAIQTIDDLEEGKRLLEIERFKLQEKSDKFEESKRSFDEEYQRSKREIEVNKRDAEVSLRELQNRVKEEQLTLKIDQASFKDEFRQYEQAKRNFQEDVEDLQSKQSELKQFEDQLNQMKSSLDDVRSLPRHSGDAASKAPAESSTSPTELGASAEIKAPQQEPSVARQDAAPQAPAADPAPVADPDDKFKPKTWNSPPKSRRGGNRGPLRIGRRPSGD